MTIGIFTDTYLPDNNGIAIATKALKDLLEAHGHKVIVVTTGTDGQKELSFEDDILRIPGLTLSFFNNYRLGSYYSSKAYHLLKKIRFDVIHIQQEFTISRFGIYVARKLMVPMVYTYHTDYEDLMMLHLAQNGKNLFGSKFTKGAMKFFANSIDSTNWEVISTSPKMKEKLELNGVITRINVIANPVDFSIFDEEFTGRDKNNFLAEKKLLNKKIFLVLGKITKDKVIPEIIEGFNAYKIKYEDKNAVLLIVGSGTNEKKIRAQIEKSTHRKDIVMIPECKHEETLKYYKSADLFLSTSHGDQISICTIEAMYCESLVLTNEEINVRELIKEGETGFYYEKASELADKIHEILILPEDQKERIRNDAKQKTVQLFSGEAIYEKIIQVYRTAIRKNI